MRVEIVTPEMVVECYDVDLPITAGDAEILKAAASAWPSERQRRRQGDSFVLSRQIEDLEAIADALAAGRQAMDAAREFACSDASLGVSEHELARRFGVSRDRIRRWRGKGK